MDITLIISGTTALGIAGLLATTLLRMFSDSRNGHRPMTKADAAAILAAVEEGTTATTDLTDELRTERRETTIVHTQLLERSHHHD